MDALASHFPQPFHVSKDISQIQPGKEWEEKVKHKHKKPLEMLQQAF